MAPPAHAALLRMGGGHDVTATAALGRDRQTRVAEFVNDA